MEGAAAVGPSCCLACSSCVWACGGTHAHTRVRALLLCAPVAEVASCERVPVCAPAGKHTCQEWHVRLNSESLVLALGLL